MKATINILPVGLLAVIHAFATTGSDISVISPSPTGSVDHDLPSDGLTYLSYPSTRTVTLTEIVGGAHGTGSSSSTAISARPSNTQACNNYPEFCGRKYSNITEVAAHNSPFVRRGNVASNQQLEVTHQLNDGIRMLQGQVHYENDTLNFCHSSCDLLYAGSVETYLTTVYDWVVAHPYDVVTILLGNSDNVAAILFDAPIQASGLGRFAYQPPKVPMALNDWPTLSEMILTQKRVVFFLDYNANQTAVPYLLDQFSQLWETPFSPTNVAFPCNVDRPQKLDKTAAQRRMYMANHNLNTAVAIESLDLLIPNIAQLNTTNAISGNSSLGAMVDECKADWNRAPNFLLVDYYNIPNGSVFQVAAEINNVTYTRTCCGNTRASDSPSISRWPTVCLVLYCCAISLVFGSF